MIAVLLSIAFKAYSKGRFNYSYPLDMRVSQLQTLANECLHTLNSGRLTVVRIDAQVASCLLVNFDPVDGYGLDTFPIALDRNGKVIVGSSVFQHVFRNMPSCRQQKVWLSLDQLRSFVDSCSNPYSKNKFDLNIRLLGRTKQGLLFQTLEGPPSNRLFSPTYCMTNQGIFEVPLLLWSPRKLAYIDELSESKGAFSKEIEERL